MRKTYLAAAALTLALTGVEYGWLRTALENTMAQAMPPYHASDSSQTAPASQPSDSGTSTQSGDAGH